MVRGQTILVNGGRALQIIDLTLLRLVAVDPHLDIAIFITNGEVVHWAVDLKSCKIQNFDKCNGKNLKNDDILKAEMVIFLISFSWTAHSSSAGDVAVQLPAVWWRSTK